jgi:tetratricopeptide (TPR) repeat protein
MIKKFSEMKELENESCHEAYFGLGKIYFEKNEITKAIEMFDKAIELYQYDPLYCLWASLAQYYIYKRCSQFSVRKKEFAMKLERYCLVAIHKNKNSKDPKDKDLNAMFIMLKLLLDLEHISVDVKVPTKYTAEDLAVMIKLADNYIGYLAWAEI